MPTEITPADRIATAEVRQLEDGRWQFRVCIDGREVERFDPVDTFEEAKRMADDFEEMALRSPGARRLPTSMQ